MAFRRLVERQSEENPEKNHVSISFLKISTCEKKKKQNKKTQKRTTTTKTKNMLFEENKNKRVHKTKNINNVWMIQ